MAKAKQGDLFSCAECGLIVTVDEACGCVSTDIICCDQPMAKGKLAADKARKKVALPKSGCATKKAPAKKAPAKKTTTSTKK